MWHGSDGFPPVGAGITRTVKILLAVTCAVFVVQIVADRGTGRLFTQLFGLSRAGVFRGYLWQLASYVFLHDGVLHLLLNVLFLVFFGREVEEALGPRRFLGLYLGAGILGGIGWLLLSGPHALCLGASGAVYGVMGTFGAMFPDRTVTLLLFFVMPVTLSARSLVLVLGAVSLLLLVGGGGDVAHAAHLAGGVAGYVAGLRARRWTRSGWSVGTGVERRWHSWWSDVAARVRRRRMRVVVGQRDPAPTPDEVDRILDKIVDQGIQSLTRAERSALDRASRGPSPRRPDDPGPGR